MIKKLITTTTSFSSASVAETSKCCYLDAAVGNGNVLRQNHFFKGSLYSRASQFLNMWYIM